MLHVSTRRRAVRFPSPRSLTRWLQQATRGRRLFQLVPALFVGFALALVPWIAYLRLSPPPSGHHSNLFWVMYDVGLMASFCATAWLMWRRRREAAPVALLTALLLLLDAGLDTLWAGTTRQLVAALLRAAFIELPIAALAISVSLRPIRLRLARRTTSSGARTRARSAQSLTRSRPAALHPRSQTP
jgi:hypothetical protein